MVNALVDLVLKIQQDPVEVLTYLFLAGLFLWLFKEFKKVIENEINEKKQTNHREIEVYGHLESYLNLYLTNPSQEVFEKITENIAQAYPYMDSIGHEKLLSVIQQDSEENIKDVLKWINSKTKRLVKQNNRIKEIRISDRIETLGTMIFVPLTYSFFTGLLIVFLVIIALAGEGNFEIYFDGLQFLLLFFLWLLLLEDFIARNFKFEWKKIVVTAVFSIILLWLVLKNGWIYVVLSILFIIIFLYILLKQRNKAKRKADLPPS